jgi:uncharacterized HAD superfamily protein
VKKLTIGLDIDGVIVDYAAVMMPVISHACGRHVSVEEICTYDITECLELDEKTADNVWRQILESDSLFHAPPIEGAVTGLSSLSGHEIWIVTGRPASLDELTERWLSERNIRYDRIVFDRTMDKMLVGPEFDVFVEDFLEGARVIAATGVLTLLFDQPWNRSDALPENCKRVRDWPAIIAAINDISGR